MVSVSEVHFLLVFLDRQAAGPVEILLLIFLDGEPEAISVSKVDVWLCRL